MLEKPGMKNPNPNSGDGDGNDPPFRPEIERVIIKFKQLLLANIPTKQRTNRIMSNLTCIVQDETCHP